MAQKLFLVTLDNALGSEGESNRKEQKKEQQPMYSKGSRTDPHSRGRVSSCLASRQTNRSSEQAWDFTLIQILVRNGQNLWRV